MSTKRGEPHLETFAPKRASAATKKLRFVLTYQPDGTIEEDKYGGATWFPRGTVNDFKLSPFTEAYAPHVKDLVFLKGVGNFSVLINSNTSGHGGMMRHCITGGGPDSIDQLVAAAWKDDGSPFPSLEFGIATEAQGSLHSRLSYAKGAAKAPEPNPLAMFQKLFAVAGNTGGVDRVLERRKSVLDAVKQSFSMLESKVSSSDRVRLDEHASSVRDIEKTLVDLAGQARACTKPDESQWGLGNQTSFFGGEKVNLPNLDKIASVQQELLVLAFKCGLTRVATQFYLRSNSGQKYDFLNVPSPQHGLAHNWWQDFRNGKGKEEMASIHTWRAQMFAKLIQSFKEAVDEDGEPLLNSSLLMYTSEMGMGSHDIQNVPMILAGRAGGALKTGRLLTYEKELHSNVFIGVARLLGLQVSTFGLDGTAPPPGLL